MCVCCISVVRCSSEGVVGKVPALPQPEAVSDMVPKREKELNIDIPEEQWTKECT